MAIAEDEVDGSVVCVSVATARHPGCRANNTGSGQPRIAHRIKNGSKWWKTDISVSESRGLYRARANTAV